MEKNSRAPGIRPALAALLLFCGALASPRPLAAEEAKRPEREPVLSTFGLRLYGSAIVQPPGGRLLTAGTSLRGTFLRFFDSRLSFAGELGGLLLKSRQNAFSAAVNLGLLTHFVVAERLSLEAGGGITAAPLPARSFPGALQKSAGYLTANVLHRPAALRRRGITLVAGYGYLISPLPWHEGRLGVELSL